MEYWNTLHDGTTPRCRRSVERARATWRRGVARRLLSDREVDALQHRARRVSHLDVPGSGPIGRHRLAAPRAPGRPAHLQLDVAHLRVAVEPHVVDARATGALHLGPADQLSDIRREGGAGVLRLPVQDRPRDHRIDDRHLRCGSGGCRGLSGVLRGESPAEEQGRRSDHSHALHDGSPSEGVPCTARRRRCSSHVPRVAAITVPAAAPATWNLTWYSRCRPAHLPANSAPTMAPHDPWMNVKP